jgi:succinate dehydrogenase/fumarate reductase iron-sulfur protein
MNVTCSVFRLESDAGKEATYARFQLEADPADTVLDILIRIYREHDPGLSFRFACGVIKCGECALMVNGVPCLACEKIVEPDMKIEPLPNLPLIKDLVIDRRTVFDRIFALLPGLSKLASSEHTSAATIDTDTADRNVTLTKCFECLICQSGCTVRADESERFAGPLGLLWLAQAYASPSKNMVSGQEIDKALQSCLRCGICSDACPCSEDILGLAIRVLEGG